MHRTMNRRTKETQSNVSINSALQGGGRPKVKSLDKNRGCFHTATDSTTTAHNSARQYALPTEDTMMAAEEKTSNIQKY